MTDCDSRLWSSPAGQRRLYDEWAKVPHLVERPEETSFDYLARMRRYDLRDLPWPVREGLRCLMGLASAQSWSQLAGIDFGACLGPPERN